MAGRLTRATGGVRLDYQYDALGRLTRKTHGNNQMPISYRYNTAGQMDELTYPDGYKVNYVYDNLSRIRWVRENTRILADVYYDGRGNLAGIDYANGTSRQYFYDGVGQLDRYTINLAGTSHDQTFFYDYSPAGELIGRTRTNSAFDHNPGFGFTDTYTANGLNQITGIDGTAVNHDTAGNLSQDENGRTYTYDAKGQLSRVKAGNTTLRTNNYYPDGTMRTFGGRRLYSSGGEEIASFMDPFPVGGSNASIEQRYIRIPGMTDEAFMMIDYTAGGTETFAFPDERGSIIATAASNGFVQNIFTYDEFGNQGGNVGATYPFRYTGQKWDGNIGLYYYKARHYDPRNGRFIQPDPIGYGDGLNMYAYVGNDPVNFADPTGLRNDPCSSASSQSTCAHDGGGGSSGTPPGAVPTDVSTIVVIGERISPPTFSILPTSVTVVPAMTTNPNLESIDTIVVTAEPRQEDEDCSRFQQLVIIAGSSIRYPGEVASYFGTLIAAGGSLSLPFTLASPIPALDEGISVGLTAFGGALAGVGTAVALPGAAIQGLGDSGLQGAFRNSAGNLANIGLGRTVDRIGGVGGAFANGALNARDQAGAILNPNQIDPRDSFFQTCFSE